MLNINSFESTLSFIGSQRKNINNISNNFKPALKTLDQDIVSFSGLGSMLKKLQLDVPPDRPAWLDADAMVKQIKNLDADGTNILFVERAMNETPQSMKEELGRKLLPALKENNNKSIIIFAKEAPSVLKGLLRICLKHLNTKESRELVQHMDDVVKPLKGTGKTFGENERINESIDVLNKSVEYLKTH